MSNHVCYSIVGDRYVSTIYRRSSALINNPPWYYETIIWEYDPETRRLGGILHMPRGTASIQFARKRHWQITESLLRRCEDERR